MWLHNGDFKPRAKDPEHSRGVVCSLKVFVKERIWGEGAHTFFISQARIPLSSIIEILLNDFKINPQKPFHKFVEVQEPKASLLRPILTYINYKYEWNTKEGGWKVTGICFIRASLEAESWYLQRALLEREINTGEGTPLLSWRNPLALAAPKE